MPYQSSSGGSFYQEPTQDPSKLPRISSFSTAASTYAADRIGYPPGFIEEALDLALLPNAASVLEIGIGPGTATSTVLSHLPASTLVGLEPSIEMLEIAQLSLVDYVTDGRLTLQNLKFEEYCGDNNQFDAVIAATSFHWIEQTNYPKLANLLKPEGKLILLYSLMPEFEEGPSRDTLVSCYEEIAKVKGVAPATLVDYPGSGENYSKKCFKILEESPDFSPVVIEHFGNYAESSAAYFVRLMMSRSSHITLGEELSSNLADRFRTAIEEQGSIAYQFNTSYAVFKKV